jgi:hypothetical protein
MKRDGFIATAYIMSDSLVNPRLQTEMYQNKTIGILDVALNDPVSCGGSDCPAGRLITDAMLAYDPDTNFAFIDGSVCCC